MTFNPLLGNKTYFTGCNTLQIYCRGNQASVYYIHTCEHDRAVVKATLRRLTFIRNLM